MSSKYVISHLDVQTGPFTEIELKAKWLTGELFPIDYVYDESRKDWLLIPELFTWANQKTDVTPPPLGEKSRLPPEPPRTEQTTITTVVAATAKEVHTHLNKQNPERPIPVGASVTLVNGIGVIDVPTATPGQVQLGLAASSKQTFKEMAALNIHVKPADPVEITWQVPLQQEVGHDLEIKIQFVDRAKQVCQHHQDACTLRIEGQESREVHVSVSAGLGSIKLPCTKTELWTLNLQYKGAHSLILPQSVRMEWTPGPAVRLILDGPAETLAGHPLKVQVQAVDQFGNLAKNYQGTVNLELTQVENKAS